MTRFTAAIAILHNIFQSYHQGTDTVGKLVFDTLGTYATTQDMNNAHFVSVLLMTTLLGDPALKIPVQQTITEYAKASCTAVAPSSYDPNGIPIYNNAPVTIAATTNSPSVKWKLMDMTLNKVIDPGTIDNTLPFEYIVNHSGSQYLIRTATESASLGLDYSKENWLVLKHPLTRNIKE